MSFCRFRQISSAWHKDSFAILVSAKEGQQNLLGAAQELKKRLQQKDKKAFIVIMDEINDANLQGIKADAYVNTACPRLADDAFSKPFVNANDIDILLEE
ncbi:MAG: diphthamide synthesis protein [Candidatus Aenigmarchaeota archaeon]|nr:diphthamide synthesis protein [Candidatus Aenigmarchaeota archaeon]